MSSINVPHKKRGRPATGKTPRVGVRLSDNMRDGIDRWIASQPHPKPSTSDAIRFALRDWLIGLGLLDYRGDEDRK